MIKSGCSKQDLLERQPEMLIKYRSGMLGYFADYQEALVPAHRPVKVYWLWGMTGSGKTWAATLGWGDMDYHMCKADSFKGKKWWCTYKGVIYMLYFLYNSSLIKQVKKD